MITPLDIVAIFITPLLLGLAAAWCFRSVASLGAAVGTWVALVSCYLFRWTLADWTILETDAKSAGGLVVCLKSAFGQLVSPSTALEWLPLAATGVLIFDVIGLFVARRRGDGNQQERELLGRRSTVFLVASLAAFSALCVGLMARLLWTSIYLTDSYSTWQQTAYLIVPAIALASIWWFGKLRRDNSDDSTLGLIALAVVTLSICVLLGTSGTIQYALFTGGAMTFPFILLLHRRSQSELARPVAGIVAVAIGTPVALGYFFAELTWVNGLAAYASLVMLMLMWPTRDASPTRRWVRALLPMLPVVVAAANSAVGMMNEIEMVPEAGSNPYINL